MVGKRVFVGKEAEGPSRGVWTLFVGREVGEEEGRRLLSFVETKGIRRVYFGAGGNRGVRGVGIVRLFRELVSKEGVEVVLEIDSEEGIPSSLLPLLSKVRVVFVVDWLKEDFWEVCCLVNSLKFVSRKGDVVWYELGDSFLTSFTDPLYTEDKEVVLCES